MAHASDVLSMKAYQGYVRAFLMDTYRKGIKGGTGETFDWALAVEAVSRGFPVILSGGLNPSNIMEAVSTVRPYGVDVNSGIEERPGKKDRILMKRFMENLRGKDIPSRDGMK
jgi:phosphoribosylanthranilate isomerase